jgi:hypothetical protein
VNQENVIMKCTNVGYLLAAATVGVSMSAFGGAGIVTTSVSSLQSNVTYAVPGATPLVTYLGYEVAIANGGGNTINNIRFTGSMQITDPAEKAIFDSAQGASCSTTTNPGTSVNDGTSIECTIGQLKAGEPAPKFAVFFKTPAKVTNAVADAAGEDHATFSGKVFYAEGAPTPPNSVADWGPIAVELGTFNPEDVRSAVPKGIAGYTVFTGDQAISKGTDKFTTLIKLPPLPSYTTAAIKESVFSAVCSSFYICDQSELTIPLPEGTTSFSPYLTIVLRQDASNIRAGTKIGNVLIDYVDDQGVLHQNIGDCASPTTPRSDYIPCIAARKYYKNRSVPGWTADLDGDFEWTLINLRNGSFRFPS